MDMKDVSDVDSMIIEEECDIMPLECECDKSNVIPELGNVIKLNLSNSGWIYGKIIRVSDDNKIEIKTLVDKTQVTIDLTTKNIQYELLSTDNSLEKLREYEISLRLNENNINTDNDSIEFSAATNDKTKRKSKRKIAKSSKDRLLTVTNTNRINGEHKRKENKRRRKDINKYLNVRTSTLDVLHGEILTTDLNKQNYKKLMKRKDKTLETVNNESVGDAIEVIKQTQQRQICEKNKNKIQIDLTLEDENDNMSVEILNGISDVMEEDNDIQILRSNQICKYEPQQLLKREKLKQRKTILKEMRNNKVIPLEEEHRILIDKIVELPANKVVGKHARSNLEVTVKDLLTLEDGQWLNEEVMNFYMSLLQDRNLKRRENNNQFKLQEYYL